MDPRNHEILKTKLWRDRKKKGEDFAKLEEERARIKKLDKAKIFNRPPDNLDDSKT